jgi:hypothetical protein
MLAALEDVAHFTIATIASIAARTTRAAGRAGSTVIANPNDTQVQSSRNWLTLLIRNSANHQIKLRE